MSARFKVLLVLLTLAMVASSIGAYRIYNALYNVIPESKDISNIGVQELPRTDPLTLKISGFPVYSGMVVRDITAKTDGTTITVTVHMAWVGLAKPTAPGAGFEYELPVPDRVKEVRIGRDAKLIWTRRPSQKKS
jgi:hypothetical protein